MRINHNISAMNTQSNLASNNKKVAGSLQKLSSGLAINRAGDNAAGLAISEKMRAQIRGLDQGGVNAQDAISMIQTAESGLNETQDILQRMRELATQAANDTYASDDRGEIQKEINQLTSEINRIGNTTEFNTQKLLNGGKTEVELKTITEGASQAKIQGQTVSDGNIGGTQNKLMEGDRAAWSATIALVDATGKAEFTIGDTKGEVITLTATATADMGIAADGYAVKNGKLYVASTASAGTRAAGLAAYGEKITNGDYTFKATGAELTITANYDDVKMNQQQVKMDGIDFDLVHGATDNGLKSGSVTQGSAASYTLTVATAAVGTSILTFNGAAIDVITVSGGTTASDGTVIAATDAKVIDGKVYVGSGVTVANKANAIAQLLNDKTEGGYTFKGSAADIVATADVRGTTNASAGSFTLATSGKANEVLATTDENIVQDKEAIAAKWEAAIGAINADGSSYKFGFNGINIDIKKGADSDFEGSNTSKFSSDSMGNTLLVKDPANKEEVARALANALTTIKNSRSEQAPKLAGFDFSSQDDKIVIIDSLTNGDKNNGLKVTNGDANKLVDVKREGRSQVTKQFDYTFENAFQRDGSSFTIAGQTFTAKNNPVSGNEFKTSTNVTDQLSEVAKLINNDAKLKASYTATVDGNKLILKQKEVKTLATADEVDKMAVGGNTAIKGESVFKIDELKSVGGSYNVNGVSIRVTDDVSDSGLAEGTAVMHSADKEMQTKNLANAIMSNEKLLQQFSGATADGSTIRLTQSAGGSDLKSTEVGAKATTGEGYEAKMQIGANSGQSMTVKVGDMRAAALKVSGTEDGSRTVTSSTGKEASYVAMANVTNGTGDESIEYALDVSTHEKATAAIDVINDAIKSVSAQRSELGAYQNRLEHTINNLGTSSENLSSAESRIRDVDMAKEMTNFQKNNILSQAAQSMLAQANQLPQGVLQLLG